MRSQFRYLIAAIAFSCSANAMAAEAQSAGLAVPAIDGVPVPAGMTPEGSANIVGASPKSDLLPPTYIPPTPPAPVPSASNAVAPFEPELPARRVFSGYPPETDNPTFQINMLSVNESHAKWRSAEESFAAGAAMELMSGIPASYHPAHRQDLFVWIEHALLRGVSPAKVSLELSRMTPEEFKRWVSRSN